VKTAKYSITDLGSFGPLSINDSGTILGSISLGDATGSQPEIWKNGTAKPFGPAGASPVSINNQGVAIGIRYVPDSALNTAKAGLLSEGSIQDLNLPANIHSFPHGINTAGAIVGNFQTYNDPQPPAGYDVREHAFVYTANKSTELPPLSGDDGAEAFDINNVGQVVGLSIRDHVSSEETHQHAVIWNNGVPTDLGTLGGKNSLAERVNDNGVVIGSTESSTAPADQVTSRRAFQWKNGKIAELPPLASGQGSFALDLNNQGVVVGYSASDFTHQTANIWVNGHPIDLNTLIPASSGYVLTLAGDINASGQIIAGGTHNGVKAYVLLTPQK